MKQKTLRRFSPLILTMALCLFLTASYIKKSAAQEVQTIESKNCTNEKKARSGMIWQSLSKHLLSLNY